MTVPGPRRPGGVPSGALPGWRVLAAREAPGFRGHDAGETRRGGEA